MCLLYAPSFYTANLFPLHKNYEYPCSLPLNSFPTFFLLLLSVSRASFFCMFHLHFPTTTSKFCIPCYHNDTARLHSVGHHHVYIYGGAVERCAESAQWRGSLSRVVNGQRRGNALGVWRLYAESRTFRPPLPARLAIDHASDSISSWMDGDDTGGRPLSWRCELIANEHQVPTTTEG